MTSGSVRAEVEDFLFYEAALLDDWKLDEWERLLDDRATYEIPPTDAPEADSASALFLVDDDPVRLRSRVRQLLGKSIWSELPRSRTRRIVSNVRILEDDGTTLSVQANFVVFRFRSDREDVYVGRYEYRLVRRNGSFRILRRRAVLDHETLRTQGRISILL
jgi:p-cumate 2,3-dioxygenase beta subunit